jgi:DeoR/GlpR family transcriptional regulator of sugar metabolism
MRGKDSREKQLLSTLEKQGKVTINETMSMFDISESTARRMLVNLERQGLAIRSFGGIQKLPKVQTIYSYTELEQEMIDEKIRIGQKAVAFVNDNDVIFISGGTTVMQMAISLKEKLLKKEIRNLTVLTSSLVIVELLGNASKLIVIGGEYRPQRRDFAGFMAEKFIKTISINKCFIGVDGINIDDGLMSYDVETARLDELIIQRSNIITVLCDSSKFSKTGFVTLAPIDCATAIVTDAGLSPFVKAEFEAHGIEMHTV